VRLNLKRLLPTAVLLLSLVYFLSFIIFYIDSYIFARTVEPIRYLAEAISKSTYFMLPSVAAIISLSVFALSGAKRALLSLAAMTLPRLIYSIPIWYLYLLPEGFDSLEALGYGSLISLGEELIVFIISLFIAALLYAVTRVRGKNRDISKWLYTSDAFDFSNALSFAIMALASIIFVYFAINDVISTVDYLTSYSYYKANEIIMIVVFFIYDVLALFLHYFALFYIKGAVLVKFGEKTQA